MFKENHSFEAGIRKENNSLIIPEFENPEELCTITYQGDRPAVSKDKTPIITMGCSQCSPLLIRQENVSALFHVEKTGLTIRQRESLKDLPKGHYEGKAIKNELGFIRNDVIEMLKKEGDIIVDSEDVEIKTDTGWYDVLYRPDENRIFIRIKRGDDKYIIEVRGLDLDKEKQ